MWNLLYKKARPFKAGLFKETFKVFPFGIIADEKFNYNSVKKLINYKKLDKVFDEFNKINNSKSERFKLKNKLIKNFNACK